MGLDITVYSGTQAVRAFDAKFGMEEYESEYHGNGKGKYCAIYGKNNPSFTQNDGLVPGVYSYTETFGFRAGSYSGYNQWRNTLAFLSGHGSAEHAWELCKDGLPADKPFIELINFSDCEGTIGPKTATKLLADFEKYDKAAQTVEDPWFYSLYEEWRKAFQMASDNGFISFH